MKKIYLLHFLFAFSSLINILHAQEKISGAQITFEEKDYCFGIVEESEENLRHEFKFTNTGNEPLIITRVSTSCGCDYAACPKDSIMPGECGVIKYHYLSMGRPGTFTKMIAVSTNSKEAMLVLYVCGNVYGKGEAKPESYNCNCNHSINQSEKRAYIQFEEKEYSFGTIEKREEKYTHDFKFINTGNEPLIFSSVRSSCGWAYATMPREPILPGESGIITYTYDAANIGAFTKMITIESNASNSIIQLRICGNVYIDETEKPTNDNCYCGTKKTKAEDSSKISFNSIETNKKLSTNDIPNYTHNKKLELHLFPNPAISLIKIEGEDIVIDKLIIFDANGKAVKQVNNEDRISTMSIDISNLANGFYSVKSFSKENIFENKLIITR